MNKGLQYKSTMAKDKWSNCSVVLDIPYAYYNTKKTERPAAAALFNPESQGATAT